MRHGRSGSIAVIAFVAATTLAGTALGEPGDVEPMNVRYRTPRESQLTCGIDSAYVALALAGAHDISLPELERRFPPGSNGWSLDDLAGACRDGGVSTHIVRAELDQLVSWGNPAVLHVRGAHYITYLGSEDGRLLIFDNSVGLIDCTRDWFAAAYTWDGIAVVVGTPSPRMLLALRWRAGIAAACVLGGLGILLALHWHRPRLSTR